MNHPLLLVSDLKVEYRIYKAAIPAIRHADIDVGHGEGVGIVGESGSGKSTLVRVLAGLLPATTARVTSGRMVFDGAAVRLDDAAAMQRLRGRGIAMIFQDPLSYLNPLMTIGRQIGEAVRLNHPAEAPVARARELLDLVHLPARCLGAYPHELSGGMRQRALIAIALACRPKLLIADEPTTALDVTTQAEILSLLKDLRREIGMSVVLISHDMGVVSELCDRIFVMYRGHTIESGRRAEILARPRHPYTRALVDAARSVKDTEGRFITLHEDAMPAVDAALLHDPVPAAAASASAIAARGQGVARAVAPTGDSILALRSVSRNYVLKTGERVAALKPMDLKIRAGEIVALVGESGSGKSTLARIALSLETPDSGEVILQGRPVASMGAAELRHRRLVIQPIFQDPSSAFNPRRSIASALTDAILCREGEVADLREAAIEVLEKVGLSPGDSFLRRFPHELSGGQRQRLGVARALAARPRLIVADEPLSGADVSIRGRILNLLLDLRDEYGLALLFITHDISIAEVFADRVLVMHRGVVVEQGGASEVLGSPRHAYTRMMKAAIPAIDLGEAGLDTRPPALPVAAG